MEARKKIKNDKMDGIKFKKYFSFKDRIVKKIVFILLFLILGIVFIALSIKVNVYTNILYYENSKVNYKVNLKNNKYYTNRTLDQDMLYIAGLLDTINIEFKYNFKTSEKLNYKYTYDVETDVQIYDDTTENIIYSKKGNITVNNVKSMKNSDNFEISKKVDINYDRYNNIAKKFISDYSIYAKSRLIINFNVKVMDENGKEYKKLNTQNNMKVVIPLTEQMINIKLDYKEVNNSDKIKKYTKVKVDNKLEFYIGCAFLLMMMIVIISLLILLIRVFFRKKTKYDKELSRLLREYDRVIVEIKKTLVISDIDIIDVNSFNELLDVRDNLDKPILFKEIHKGEKSEFIVKGSKEVYRYYLKSVDLENK